MTTKLSASPQRNAPAELPKNQFLIVVTGARQKLALDSDRCVQILREAGHLDTTTVSCVVDLGYIPDGLDAAELEQYLREHGTRGHVEVPGPSKSRPETVDDNAP